MSFCRMPRPFLPLRRGPASYPEGLFRSTAVQTVRFSVLAHQHDAWSPRVEFCKAPTCSGSGANSQTSSSLLPKSPPSARPSLPPVDPRPISPPGPTRRPSARVTLTPAPAARAVARPSAARKIFWRTYTARRKGIMPGGSSTLHTPASVELRTSSGSCAGPAAGSWGVEVLATTEAWRLVKAECMSPASTL